MGALLTLLNDVGVRVWAISESDKWGKHGCVVLFKWQRL